jgi:hypothetical protein
MPDILFQHYLVHAILFSCIAFAACGVAIACWVEGIGKY